VIKFKIKKDYSAVSQTRKRFQGKLEAENKLKRKYHKIEEQIDKRA